MARRARIRILVIDLKLFHLAVQFLTWIEPVAPWYLGIKRTNCT
jgi:hypothetical protein